MNKIFSEKRIIDIIKWISILSFAGILLTVYVYYKKGLINKLDIDPDQMQGFGSFISGLFGTLFVIATTALVYLTYRSQKIELQESQEILRRQRFEGTFFSMLQVHQEIKKGLRFRVNDRISYEDGDRTELPEYVEGSEFLKFAHEDFHRFYIARPELVSPRIVVNQLTVLPSDEPEFPPMEEPLSRIKMKWKYFFDNYHRQLSHYFRQLFYILDFVAKSEKDELSVNPQNGNEIKERFMFYANLVQAQMDSSELFLFFYNGICFRKANELIMKYKLVENLAAEDLADRETHENLYGVGSLKSRSSIWEE